MSFRLSWQGRGTGLTGHSPWQLWAGWSGQCSQEERQTQWLHCKWGSECCAWSMFSSSSAACPHTSGTPSHTDLGKNRTNVRNDERLSDWQNQRVVSDSQTFPKAFPNYSPSSFSIIHKNNVCHECTWTPTWRSSDVHGFEIPGFDDGDGKSAGRGEIAQWEHELSQIHIVLRTDKLHFILSVAEKGPVTHCRKCEAFFFTWQTVA